MKKINRYLVAILILIALIIFSCRKEYENLPYKPANDGARLTIAQVKTRVIDSTSMFRFAAGDTNLYCTVTADETSGNFYRQVFVRDDFGGAIQVNLLNSGGIFTGDKIRINLNNVPVICANRMIYLDSVDVEKQIVKLSSGNPVAPLSVNLNSVVAQLNPLHLTSLQSQLVEINNVEFTADGMDKPFGDVIGKGTLSYILKNCSGSEALVRTSGFANFAGKLTPKGNGKIVALVTQYKNDIQLLVRNYNEVQMTGPLCIPIPTITGIIYELKDFNDFNITAGGWASYSVTNNSVKWSVSTYSNTQTPFAKISGFSGGGNVDSECWLVSPPLAINSATNPVLSFYSAAKFAGTLLEVLASKTYTGGNPATAAWTSLAPGYTLSPSSGSYNWTFSGYVPLSAYKSSTTRIAFRYKSTTAGATTYEIDDIVVKEN